MKNEPLRGNREETDVDSSEKQRTFMEEAKKKGYYKKEDGTWWRVYDDGSDEQAEWFKLDEKYPDLADKTKKLAKKYHVWYDDNSDFKGYIWKHADELKDADDEHLARIFRIAGAITLSGNSWFDLEGNGHTIYNFRIKLMANFFYIIIVI